MVELFAKLGVHGRGVHSPSSDEASLDELVRVDPEDLAVLASRRLVFVCVDEVSRSKKRGEFRVNILTERRSRMWMT
jgi:hypothetical protein